MTGLRHFFFFFLNFISALWMVYMTQEPESMPSYRSFPITLFSQFELSVGLIDLPVDHTISTPPIVHVLHCTFSVVSYILLLNLLIAMMSDTHWRVAQERDELWRTQVSHTYELRECSEKRKHKYADAPRHNVMVTAPMMLYRW